MADVNIDVELRARVDKEFKNLNKRLDGLNKSAKDNEKSFGGFSTKLIGAAAAIGAVSAAVSSVVDAAIQMEDLRTQFIAFTGSAESAAEQVERIAEFASETPFQLDELAEANRTLLAFGVSAEDSFVVMKQLGEAAAATGKPIGDLATIFGQVQAAGKLTGERFLQLAERGINLGPALAQGLGVAESELEGLRAAGKITADDFNRAFASMTDEGGQFAGSMKRQSQTISGSFSTLKDNIFALQASLGEFLAPAITFVISEMNNAVKVTNAWFKSLKPEQLSPLEKKIETTKEVLGDYVEKLDELKKEGPGFFQSQAAFNKEFENTEKVIRFTTEKLKEFQAQREKLAQSEQKEESQVEQVQQENAALTAEAQKFNDELQELSKQRAANEQQIRQADNEALKEQLSIRNEEILAKEAEKDAALLESQGLFEEASLIRAEEAVRAKKALEDKALKEEKARNKKARDEEFNFEAIHQKALLKFEQQTWSQRAATARVGLSALASLQSSGNRTFFEIGKAAAIAQTLIDIPLAAQKAYTSLAAFPPLAAAAAAAAVIAGTARLNQIRSTNMTAFADGGLVTGGIRGKDSVPALLTPGEVVLPEKDFSDLNFNNDAQIGLLTEIKSILMAQNQTGNQNEEVSRTINVELVLNEEVLSSVILDLNRDNQRLTVND